MKRLSRTRGQHKVWLFSSTTRRTSKLSLKVGHFYEGRWGKGWKIWGFPKINLKETFTLNLKKKKKKTWCLGGKNTAKQSLLCITVILLLGFPGGSDSKESTCNAGNLGSIPRLGIFPGEGNHYPLQYSGRENFMDRGA